VGKKVYLMVGAKRAPGRLFPSELTSKGRVGVLLVETFLTIKPKRD